MAMVAVVYLLPTGVLLAQADWFGPKVSGHWRCFCSHRVNRVNSRSALNTMSEPVIYDILLLY